MEVAGATSFICVYICAQLKFHSLSKSIVGAQKTCMLVQTGM